MKKLALFMMLLMSSLSLTLFGCGKSNDDVIRLNEVAHSIFYAPMYVAINNGYFEDVGLKVELTLGNGADQVMTALLTGGADIGLMGPEACVYVAAQGREDLPTVFGQLTKRDGSFLFSKNETFDWSELAGKEILAGRVGGVPEMTLEYVLRQKGYTLDGDVTLNTKVAFANQGPSFVNGTGDYTTLFEPTATQLQRENRGYVVASIGEEAGEIPYTCFAASKSYLNKNKEKVKNFLRAIMRGYDFLVAKLSIGDTGSVYNALYPSFREFDKESIYQSIERYNSIDSWNETPIMTESAYNRLIEIMKGAKQLTVDVPMSKIIDNSIANELMQEIN